jgi:methylated-DNA-[protein]-cysteine S-methyltransferase
MAAAATQIASVDSPVGRLSVTGSRDAVTAVSWQAPDSTAPAATGSAPAIAARQLADYFAGNRTTFDVPLMLEGSDHQQRVWAALLDIPFGEVISYGELARRISSAPRAVGTACGRNPIAILVPCHRVIAGNGRLTGYSAGAGIETKRQLLALEGQHDLFATAPS